MGKNLIKRFLINSITILFAASMVACGNTETSVQESKVEVTETKEPEVEVTETEESKVEVTETKEPEVEVTETEEPEVEVAETVEPEVEVTEPKEIKFEDINLKEFRALNDDGSFKGINNFKLSECILENKIEPTVLINPFNEDCCCVEKYEEDMYIKTISYCSMFFPDSIVEVIPDEYTERELDLSLPGEQAPNMLTITATPGMECQCNLKVKLENGSEYDLTFYYWED